MEENLSEAEFEGVGAVDMTDDEPILSVYEIGYHLVPTLSEEALLRPVSALMGILKGEKAVFVGERFPSKIQLAYPIAKRFNEKRTNYDSAYFGWVAFELPREAIARIKIALDGNPNILRYLIVMTDRAGVAAAMSGAVAATPTGTIDKPKRDAEGGGELSETALDEALQTIATEDAKVAE